jgi:N-acetyl sugar amidotransferase
MNNSRIFSEYNICKKLVLDTSYPGISFDAEGVCNHYHEFFDVVKPNWHNNRKGFLELEQKIDKIKKAGYGRDYDCIMGLSGGADSSYMLHVMVTEFGLRPLVFHVDGGWNSEVAVNNISGLIEKLNLDLFTEVINWEEMRDFQLAMFKSGVPHLDIPQDMAFVGVLYKFAQKHGIKYILNGGNISTECVKRPLDIIYWGTDMIHIKDIINRYGTLSMDTYPFSSVFYHKLYLQFFRGVKVLKPLNYISYVKQDAMDLMKKEYGWKQYSQKHFESRFTRFFEGYWLTTRFDFDMRRVDLSSLILTEQITRNDALAILEEPPYDLENIQQDFDYIAKKLNISIEDLKMFHEMPKKYYWDFRNMRYIFELGEWFLSRLIGARRGGAF